MKHRGPALKSVMAVAVAATGIYMLSILVEAPAQWVFGLGLSAMVGIVWMAIRILKDPYSTDKTFDDCFYMDRPDLGPGARE